MRLVSLFVVALCLTSSATASQFCPANSGTYYWHQQETGVNNGDTDHWFMSPCTKATPTGHNTAVYLVIKSLNGQVRIPYTEVGTAWYAVEGSNPAQFKANFEAPQYSVYVNVTVTCDPSVPHNTVMGNGVAHSVVHGGACYTLPIKMNCAGLVTPAPTPEPDCTQFTTCKSCTASISGTCGYCSASKECHNGNFNGPKKGSCPAGKWEWYSQNCS